MSAPARAERLDTMIKRLEARGAGGHPDGPQQDDFLLQVADMLRLLASEANTKAKRRQKKGPNP